MTAAIVVDWAELVERTREDGDMCIARKARQRWLWRAPILANGWRPCAGAERQRNL